MIYLYPANKMENLLALFNKIQQVSPPALFSQEIILVQNQGMQHWLNLSIAQQRGITMNFSYALPSQFLWKLIRSLVHEQSMPDQSPYAREVLVWRIEQLLQQPCVIEDACFASVTRYWQDKNAQQAALKRYQLAMQLADLFEQYLIFRPDWLHQWQQGKQVSDTIVEHHQSLMTWQAQLWQLLVNDIAYDPVTLINHAKTQIANHLSTLPKRISFFGINCLPPIWLDFIASLSEHIQVHFFHLNPCDSYWGDILSEKQALRQSQVQWADLSIAQTLIGNPLLANFGQQGREFLSLLQHYSTINIELYEQAGQSEAQLSSSDYQPNSTNTTVLQHIQNDILQLTDARTTPRNLVDDSVVITSAHSALREVQGLHDWLLHQFNNNPSLTPKDVLVMCPQVEQYAPYIESVFTQGWRDLNHHQPPLPCSIADRITKDADPLIAAFLELLTLPDSRFQVSILLSYLRLPALQRKFSLNFDELEQISEWLSSATIHWGLNAEHKQQVLGNQLLNDKFTWQQGISRLLLGFAYGPETVIYQQQLLTPVVEGEQTLLLGKLLLVLEQLQNYSRLLISAKTSQQWQKMLSQLVNDFFDDQGEHSFTLLQEAINALVEYTEAAFYQHALPLTVVREFLSQHFSEPDSRQQFMVGQVTFCSLLPMRSIPFKVIAILGLNAGDFPRQRTINSFDLMNVTRARVGDRSKRGDDRYLFLEAIICARQSLYLSYQGRSIRNNAIKQPSIVLQEFMAYLQDGYTWSLTDDSAQHLRQLPMQPFSEHNYLIEQPSFDRHWLALGQKSTERQPPLQILPEQLGTFDDVTLSATELVRFFNHPAKYFAQQQLSLRLEQPALTISDIEPFTENGLSVYMLREQLLAAQLARDESLEQAVLAQALCSGMFPDSPLLPQQCLAWQADSKLFAEQLLAHGVNGQAQQPVLLAEITLSLANNNTRIRLVAELPVYHQHCCYYRSSAAKAKDFLLMYINQLILQIWQKQVEHQDAAVDPLVTVVGTKAWFFDTKSKQVKGYQLEPISSPEAKLMTLLEYYYQGRGQALLLNAELGQRWANDKLTTQYQFEQHWQASQFQSNIPAFGNDPYIRYFWPTCPDLNAHLSALEQVYGELFTAIKDVKHAI